MYFKFPIIDTHIHLGDITEIRKAAKTAEYDQYVLISSSLFPQAVLGNLELLQIKKEAPTQIYAYACFHMAKEGAPAAEDLLQQAKLYYKSGFDGVKLLGGKPNVRKAQGISLCDECYDPMYTFLEETGMPVLLHSNDPVEFWDEKRIPDWAKQANYNYDMSYPTHEQIREETIGILKKHPGLKITIAHFFFLSNANQYELANELMETYPNLYLDLCPGWEMFAGFERDARWRSFIEKYADRLVYGTDISGGGWKERMECLRSCLETDEIYHNSDGYCCKGLKLSDTALKKIYHDTYRTFLQPGLPKQIHAEVIRGEYLPLVEQWIDFFYLDKPDQRTEMMNRAKELASI